MPPRRFSSRRRYSRRRIPGSTSLIRGTRTGRDFPLFARARPRQLVRVWPTSSSTHERLLNVAWTDTGTTTGSAVEVMNQISQGTSTEQRVGNRIFMRSLILDVTFNFLNRRNLIDANFPFDFRVAVIYDRRPNGTFPNPGDVFDDAEPLAFPRQATRDRFEILYLKTITSNPISVFFGSTVPVLYGVHRLVHRRISVPIRRPATYVNEEASGTLADIVTGALYVCAWCLDPVNTANNAKVFWRHKLSFTDYT